MGQNRSATARMLEGLGSVRLNAPMPPPQSPIDLSSLGEVQALPTPPKNMGNELQSLGDVNFESPYRKAIADEMSSLGSTNVNDVVHDYPKPPGSPAGFGRAASVGDPNVPESVANEDPSPIQTTTSTSHWNVPNRGNMEPFGHMGARALTKLKGIMPQQDTGWANSPAARLFGGKGQPQELAGPPPTSPGAPAWTKPMQGNSEPGEFDKNVGLPNVPYLDSADTVNNDDPNTNIRMQLGAIDPKTAPSVLQGLRSAGGMDESKLYAMQDKIRDDVAMNLSKAQGAGSSFMTGATPEHMRQLNSDLAPLDQYRGQKQDYAQKQYEANLGGFKSPQEASAFGQSLEAHKVASPATVAGIQAQGNVDVQKLRESGNDSFLDRLMSLRAAGLNPGDVVRGPNGIQFSSAPVSPGLATAGGKSVEQIAKELYNLENPGQVGPIPIVNPWQDTQKLIAAKKAELAEAQARATGRPAPATPAAPKAATPSGMSHVAVGTKGTIKGVPVTWDGANWIAED